MAHRGALGSSLILLAACATQELPLGERDGGQDSGVGGSGGDSGAAGTGGSSGSAGVGGASGSAGADGSAGAGGSAGASACTPTDSACYPSGPGGPGNECLAQRNNSGASRVQVRSVWTRSIAPAGNTSPTIYDILRT